MAIKNTDLGGTDWIDGAVLEAADLNDTFDATFSYFGIQSSSGAEDTAEYSATADNLSTAWTDLGYSKTFTPPLGTNNMLVGIKLKFDYKSSSGDHALAYKAILTNNTTSATADVTVGVVDIYSGEYGKKGVLLSGKTSTSYAEATAYAFLLDFATWDQATAYNEFSTSDISALIGGATYTLKFYVAREENGGTDDVDGYIKDITPTIYWQYLGDNTVSGWA